MSAAESEPPPVADLATARANADRARLYADVLDRLALSDRKVPLATLSNAILVLSGDPVTSGLLAYDEFSSRSVLLAAPPPAIDGTAGLPGPYPRPWTAADVAALQSYVQRTWIRSIARDTIADAVLAVATSRRIHPVRAWLDSLHWDGRARLDGWLVPTFGAPDDDYHSAVGAKWLIAACRRVRHPGCQFDHMPVFEGAQGIGKSSALRALFGDAWFSDALPDSLGSRDAALGLQGVWCVELAEIEQLIRGEVETIKAFLSRRVDHYRAPYGRTYEDHPRQCVLAGSTNDTDYLRDASGNRRFWPVRCSTVELGWLEAHRDQLWAEAAAREASGEAHWLTEQSIVADATREQASRVQEDVWEDRVLEWLARTGARETTCADVLGAIGVPVERQDKRTQMRAAKILRVNGWERAQNRRDGIKARRWIHLGS